MLQQGYRRLDFKRFKDINLALLSKLGWMIAIDDNRLWVEVLRRKYLQGDSFFSCTWKMGDSPIWKGILNSREVIARETCYKIGNGWSINLNHDPWIPRLVRSWPRIEEDRGFDSMTKVAELINLNSMTWNEELLYAFFDNDTTTAICKLELPLIPCEDKLCWTAAKDGKFSVKSCFRVIQRQNLD